MPCFPHKFILLVRPLNFLARSDTPRHMSGVVKNQFGMTNAVISVGAARCRVDQLPHAVNLIDSCLNGRQFPLHGTNVII